MKEKIFNLFIIIISLFVLIELIIKKNIIYISVMYALRMWVNNLIPALFPFFIISDILINYNITNYIPQFIKNICKKMFNISDSMFTVLFLSMVSGFPSNARNTRLLYDKKLLSLEEANHILIFTHFANPIFILTTVSIFFLHNEKLGIILLITHYLSNIIMGIIFRNNNTYGLKKSINDNYMIDFGNVLVNSIKKSIDTILTICGIIIVFLVLSTIIIDTFKLNSYNSMLIKGMCEVTIGIEALSKLNINNIYKCVLASMILAFGGISVHVQVISQIVDTPIKYIYFFIGRMYQMIISGILTYIFCIILRI